MTRDPETWRDYERVAHVLKSGNDDDLDALRDELEGFPHGVDAFLGRRWITHAIHLGSQAAIRWMLSHGVDLAFRDEEGYTPLHSAMERRDVDRHEVIELLLRAGAAVNLKGVNDWTPAHMAAARDDVEALKLLVRHGADLTIRTDIDDYATPLEEARLLGKREAARYLETLR